LFNKLTHSTKVNIYGFIVLFVALISITSGSMWGDEICRVEAPAWGSFRDIYKVAAGYAQPGYYLYMTIWTRLVGTTEFLIRCSNLPFVCVCLYFVFKIISARSWPLEFVFLFFIHPIFVYYMDEATPYIIVYALSLAFIYYTFFCESFDSRRNALYINLIFLLGVFIHFIFGFVVILYFVKLVFYILKKHPVRNHIQIGTIFLIAYLPLLYLYTQNLNGPTTGFSIKNVLYIVYAFLGMAGLGLSRNDLRAGNFSNIQAYHVILLFLCASILLTIAYFVIRQKIFKPFFKNSLLLISAIVYFGIFLGISMMIDFGVWERHCIPVFPVYLIILCDLLDEIIKTNPLKQNRVFYCTIFLYGLLLIVSALNMRFNYYYSCDDHQGVKKEIDKAFCSTDELILLTTTDIGIYYPLDEYAIKSGHSIIDVSGWTSEELKNFINEKNNQMIVLILFEKSVSKETYNCFDNAGYWVDNKLNSFKIVYNYRL